MYLSLPMMTDSMVSSLCQLCTTSSYLKPTSFSNCTFPFEDIPSSLSHLYSILLTLLFIFPLLTQLGFDCFVCLCIYDLVFLFCCLFVYFCDLVFTLLLVFFCFAGTAHLSQYSHISLLANKEIRRQHLYRLDPKSTKSTIIQMQKALQTICRACLMRKGYDNPGRVSF